MDIRQAPAAVAAVTLGKDMTLRDYAQGAWRMRQIGRGQRLELIVVPEVAKLVAVAAAAGEGRPGSSRAAELERLTGWRRTGAAPRRLRDVLAWLVVNGMRAENVQAGLLAEQRAANIWRKHAYRALLDAGVHVMGSKDGEGRERRCLDVFRERVSFVVSNAVPHGSFASKRLAMAVSEHSALLIDDEKASKALQSILREVAATEESTAELRAKLRGAEASGRGDLDALRTRWRARAAGSPRTRRRRRER